MSDESLLDFSRAAADALRSALPLAEFLRGRGMTKAAEAVSRGEPLHSALGPAFPPLFVALVRAGEESGRLDAFLDRFSASVETRIDFRRRLSRVLAYPSFAFALAVGLFLLFTAKAAPLLLLPLSQAGVTLPPEALRALDAGDWLRANWALALGGAVGAWLILRELARSRPGRIARAVAGRLVPGLRYISSEARACELEATLGLLLGAGLRPRECFDVLLQVVAEDPLLRRSLSAGAALLPGGASFAECVAPSLPAEDRPRFMTAEKAGRLDEALARLAESHRERHLHRLKAAAIAVQIGSVAALAPLCFALVMGLVWPALATLRAAGAQTGASEAAMPKAETSAKPDADSAAASRFNESNAPALLGFMREHAPAPEAAGPAEARPEGGEAKKKKMKTPHLKPMTMQRLQPRGVQATDVRSRLE